MNPFVGQTNNGYTVNNGVVEVQISINVNGQSDSTVRNAATTAVSTLLGIPDLSTKFDHVMLCLPPGTTGGWIAYGRSYLMRRAHQTPILVLISYLLA
jgi:hypothetical protein